MQQDAAIAAIAATAVIAVIAAIRKLCVNTGRERAGVVLAAGLLVTLLMLPAPAMAQVGGGYDLSWNTVDGGGVTLSSGGQYSIGGTAGQPDAGSMSGGTYGMSGGFWGIGLASTPTRTPTSTPTNTPTNTPGPGCDLAWRSVSSPNGGPYNDTLRSVAAVSSTDVWAVGDYYDINGAGHTLTEHWNGVVWSMVTSPDLGTGANELDSVTVVAANDVWAAGFYYDATASVWGTLVLHWNGAAWSVISSPNPSTLDNRLQSISAVSASDVWAVGFHANNNEYYQTLVEHWNGSTWTIVPSPDATSYSNHLEAVHAISPNDVWAVGDFSHDASGVYASTLTMHWNGSTWSVVTSPDGSPNNNYLRGVSATGPNDVWAVGYYGAPEQGDVILTLHWDGSSWSIVASPNPVPDPLSLDMLGVVDLAPNDVWAVGYSYYNPGGNVTLADHWDGSSWSIVHSPNPSYGDELNGIAASSANDLWAVGRQYDVNNNTQTLIERYNDPCGPSAHIPPATRTVPPK